MTNTNSKVNLNNVSNVQSGGSSKTNKHLKVNESGSGFKKNNPIIPIRTRRTGHVSIVERKTIIFANINP